MDHVELVNNWKRDDAAEFGHIPVTLSMTRVIPFLQDGI